jgi:hypothetical protein
MHRISDNRVGGISRRNIRVFKNLCGAESLKNVFIVTTMWGSVPEEVGAAREAEYKTTVFKHFLDNGAHLARLPDVKPLVSAHEIIASLLQNDPLPLLIQQELSEGKNILETAAGSELNAELARLVETQKEEIENVRKEMIKAMQDKDSLLTKELVAERQKLEDDAKRWELDRQKLKDSLEADRAAAMAMKEALETAFESQRRDLEARLRREKEDTLQRLQEDADRRIDQKVKQAQRDQETLERRIQEMLADGNKDLQKAMAANNREWEQKLRDDREAMQLQLQQLQTQYSPPQQVASSSSSSVRQMVYPYSHVCRRYTNRYSAGRCDICAYEFTTRKCVNCAYIVCGSCSNVNACYWE